MAPEPVLSSTDTPGRGAIFGSMWWRTLLLGLVLAAPAAAQQGPEWESRRRERERLVDQHIAAAGIRDRATLDALRAVPRHEFVPASEQTRAYEDIPLPIGQGQTISQPAVVATMTELIKPRPGLRVLEIGTGSGYQAAVLAATGARVWTIELFERLAREARERLARLGYANVVVRHGDGYAGWPEEAPFDAIVVTAAADSIPPALLDQLAPGGRLVMPVGSQDTYQELVLVRKDAAGKLTTRQLLPVRFVPLLRGVR
jgi:protein-L-isoaspartate(D-aspartate) O-methyltransferase